MSAGVFKKRTRVYYSEKSLYKSMKEGKLCYLFVSTISKLIQAARTKDFYLQESLDSTCENQHVSHVCGWNEREFTNTNHS